ncbi:ABC transporter substrate-binding protein [Paractinoplanes rishiriensis]|uniref:ABC transporter substrate-binding protein n=1 Tax=Paractinoplanes rishiriensis TaxID=1050105 RepID=A0A919JX10_9ACTN|nr:ABC transporter substrate-binding protein [Actinoplanes rishiriensis]GIE94683.1 ABC transporter substrate-binding protein [Actinoplanes rishiriensis]
MRASRRTLLGVAFAALTASCGRGPDPAGAGTAPLEVGVLYAGLTYPAGFGAGVQYATHRTNRIGGRSVAVQWVDDQGDPEVATAAAERLIARGVRVLAGGSTSEVALRLATLAAAHRVLFISGPAEDDTITGVNRYTFRSGRQAYQDLLALRAVAGTLKNALLVAPSPDALAAAAPVFGIPGVVAPPDAKGIDQRPDQVIVLPGPWPAAFWETLVRDHPSVFTVLGARSTWRDYGTAGSALRLAGYYFDGAENNFASRQMRAFAPGRRSDLSQPAGFVGAQLVVRALQYGPDDVDRMIAALEGFEFSSANGFPLRVRAEDHALVQPMFQAWLIPVGTGYSAITAAKLDAAVVAPPPVRAQWR